MKEGLSVGEQLRELVKEAVEKKLAVVEDEEVRKKLVDVAMMGADTTMLTLQEVGGLAALLGFETPGSEETKH